MSAVCESCGSAHTHQVGARGEPFPGDGTPTIVTEFECLDCMDRWNVWS